MTALHFELGGARVVVIGAALTVIAHNEDDVRVEPTAGPDGALQLIVNGEARLLAGLKTVRIVGGRRAEAHSTGVMPSTTAK